MWASHQTEAIQYFLLPRSLRQLWLSPDAKCYTVAGRDMAEIALTLITEGVLPSKNVFSSRTKLAIGILKPLLYSRKRFWILYCLFHYIAIRKISEKKGQNFQKYVFITRYWPLTIETMRTNKDDDVLWLRQLCTIVQWVNQLGLINKEKQNWETKLSPDGERRHYFGRIMCKSVDSDCCRWHSICS